MKKTTYYYFVSYALYGGGLENAFGHAEYPVNEKIKTFKEILSMEKAIERALKEHLGQKVIVLILNFKLLRIERKKWFSRII